MKRFRRLLGLAFFSLSALVSIEACGDKPPPPPIFDAGPVVPVPTGPTVIEELPVEDAGVEDADAAKPKTGPGTTANQAKVLQCCRAIDLAAKGLGPGSAEGGALAAQAATCKTLAAQVRPDATGAELAPIRQFLKTVKLPGLCAGL